MTDKTQAHPGGLNIMPANIEKSRVFYTGWHIECSACDLDTTNAGSQGYTTKKEAEAALRLHKKKECKTSQKCTESARLDGLHQFETDYEYDESGKTINCIYCGTANV